MITFVHTADIHLGMENYGKIDPKTGIHTRLLDFSHVLNYCVDYAIDKQVDLFLFSGDAYKTAHPSQTHQKLLLQSFMRLYKAKIPVVIIIGNHDHPISFGKTNALDLFSMLPIDGFHVIAKPTILPLATKHGPLNIVGIPWPTRNTIAISATYAHTTAHELTRHISQAVVAIIKNFAAKLDPTIPAVLAGHLTVANGIFSGSEKRAIYGTDPLFLATELAISPFDYVALGHLHRYQNLMEHGYPAVVYSGSLERIDFGERNDEKGFCSVTIPKKGKATYEFIKTPTRPFLQIEVPLKERDIPFTQQILQTLALYHLQGAIVKILYQLPAHSVDTVDLKQIQYACQSAHYLAGILPIRHNNHKERRTHLPIDKKADIASLLSLYCETKPILKSKKDILINLTQELIAQQEEIHLQEELN